MGAHTFSKTGYTTVTLSVAPHFPYGRRIVPRTRRSRNDAGTVVVATLGSPDTFYELVFSDMPASDVANVEAFFAAIGYDALTWTWTDHEATARTVRLWSADLGIIQHAPDCFDLTLNLLELGD